MYFEVCDTFSTSVTEGVLRSLDLRGSRSAFPRSARISRGKTKPATVEVPVTNNIVLKKLRVAFELKDSDVIAAIEKAGPATVSKSELSAFFRKPDHRNYRPVGDQFLRHLIKGMK
jgi:uncharacterized protein YehS (DUF1456 family)